MGFFLLALVGVTIAAALLQANLGAQARSFSLAIRLPAGAVLLAFAAIVFRAPHGFLWALMLTAGAVALWLADGRWLRRRALARLKRRSRAAGSTERITTAHLSVLRDEATGALVGKVLRGMFEGREIGSLKTAEIALIWQDCRFADVPSAKLLEAHLDFTRASWREDVDRGEREMRGKDGRLQPTEALEILGIAAGASEDEIRRAHRALMLKHHPDRGGSTYLAARVNEAKDVLLALTANGGRPSSS